MQTTLVLRLPRFVVCSRCDGTVGGAHPTTAPVIVPVAGDVNADGATDVDDLIYVITMWGECEDDWVLCPGNLDFSGTVDEEDLGQVLVNWGAGG